MRRIALDPETFELLRTHRERYEVAAHEIGAEPGQEPYLFSYEVLHDRPGNPHGVSHRDVGLCAQLGVNSHR